MAEKKPITFEITKHVAVLSERNRGWRRELNMIKWNDLPAKLDLRDWDEAHVKMSKGITLNFEEVSVLKEILDEQDLDKLFA